MKYSKHNIKDNALILPLPLAALVGLATVVCATGIKQCVYTKDTPQPEIGCNDIAESQAGRHICKYYAFSVAVSQCQPTTLNYNSCTDSVGVSQVTRTTYQGTCLNYQGDMYKCNTNSFQQIGQELVSKPLATGTTCPDGYSTNLWSVYDSNVTSNRTLW